MKTLDVFKLAHLAKKLQKLTQKLQKVMHIQVISFFYIFSFFDHFFFYILFLHFFHIFSTICHLVSSQNPSFSETNDIHQWIALFFTSTILALFFPFLSTFFLSQKQTFHRTAGKGKVLSHRTILEKWLTAFTRISRCLARS